MAIERLIPNRYRKSLPVVNDDVNSILPRFNTNNSLFGTDQFLAETFGTVHDYYNCPAYWSKKRERYLRKCIFTNSWIASAHWNVLTKLRAIPFIITAKDPSNSASTNLAEVYNEIFQATWHTSSQQFLNDVMGQDNGGWLEVLDDPRFANNSPLSPRIGFGGVRHLDSYNVTRRRNETYPITYRHTDGNDYALHRTRVINLTQMPSSDPDLLGIGLSSVSRALDYIHSLDNVRNIYDEYIGRRPISRILAVFGASARDLNNILDKAEEKESNKALRWLSKTVRVGFRDPRVKLQEILLKRLPDGFDKKAEIDLAMYGVASAYGVDAREIWPVMSAGATKADTEIAHFKTQGKTPAWFIQSMIREMIRVLPPSLTIEAQWRDEKQDEVRANLLGQTIKNITSGLNTEMLDGRAGRLMLRDNGFVSESEFERLELESGRLTDGEPIVSLFYSRDALIRDLLTVPNLARPLDTFANDFEQALEAIARHKIVVIEALYETQAGERRKRTKRALYALESLEKIYQDAVMKERQQIAAQAQFTLSQTELDRQTLSIGDDLGEANSPEQQSPNSGSFDTQDVDQVSRDSQEQ